MEIFKQRRLAHVLMVLVITCLSINDVCGNLFKFEMKHKRRLGKENRIKRAVKYVGSTDNLIGKPGEGYYMEVEIGTPKQKLNVLIDTGSSNFAVACDDSLNVKKYFKMNESSTFVDTGRTLSVPYTMGSWDGILGHDFVTFTALPNATVKANIACITKEVNFFINGSNWQGILGLGYAYIARPDSSVEPVFDAMVREDKVENWFSVQLCGTGAIKQDGTVNGSVLFGSLDPSQYTGELYGTPINRERYYEVVIIDIQVAGESLNMDCKEYNTRQTIVDTGTTNLRLPDRVFDSLVAKIQQNMNFSSVHDKIEAGFWEGDKFKCYVEGQVPYDDYPPVTITLPVNQTYSFDLVVTSQQYLLPASDSEATLIPGDICFKFGISRIQEGTVIGAVVLEGYHVIFDRLEKQVKFGVTTCPPADPDSKTSTVVGNSWHRQDYVDCAFKEVDYSQNEGVYIAIYIFTGISVLCLVPLTILCYKQCGRRGCKTVKRTRTESESPVTESFVDCDS